MALGYAFGAIVVRPAEQRHRACVRIGLVATATFLALGGALVAFSPQGEGPPALFQLLNQRKYPASQLFLLDDPRPADCAAAARRAGPWLAGAAVHDIRPGADVLLPVHIPLIHVLALIVWKIRDGQVNAGWFASAPYVDVPPEQRWSLALLYLVFVLSIAALYFPCRWFAGVKKRSRSALIRYVERGRALFSLLPSAFSPRTRSFHQRATATLAARRRRACLFSGRGRPSDEDAHPPAIRRSGPARQAPAHPLDFCHLLCCHAAAPARGPVCGRSTNGHRSTWNGLQRRDHLAAHVRRESGAHLPGKPQLPPFEEAHQ